MGENICKFYISYRVHILNIQEMHTTQKKKNWKKFDFKMVKGLEYMILLSCFAVLCFTNTACYFLDWVFVAGLHRVSLLAPFFQQHYIFFSFGCPGFSCSTWVFSCSMWDLVPWPRIKPKPPALGAQRLSHWTTREVLALLFN